MQQVMSPISYGPKQFPALNQAGTSPDKLTSTEVPLLPSSKAQES